MADNTLHFEWIVKIKMNLDWLFKNDPNVFIAGDLLWYPVEGNNKIRTAPDAMVAFGRPKGTGDRTGRGRKTTSRHRWCSRFCHRSASDRKC